MTISLAADIAKRLRAARKAAGYKSAKDFANSHNMPISTYSQHETGKRSINTEMIMIYSRRLHVNPHWLFSGNDDPYFGKSEITKKHVIEHECYTLPQPFTADTHHFVDRHLLKNVLIAAEPLFADHSIKLTYHELISYCFEVYDIVSTLTVDLTEKIKIINLTISSLKRGVKTQLASDNKMSTSL